MSRSFELKVCTQEKFTMRIGFVIAVTKTDAGILRRKSIRGDGRIFDVVGIRIVGNLVIVLAQRSNETQLVGRIDVEDERSEAAVSVVRVVNDLRNRRLNPEIAAIAVYAGIVSEPFGVAAEVELRRWSDRNCRR